MSIRLARNRGRMSAQQRHERSRRQPPEDIPFIAAELPPPRPQRLFDIRLKSMRAMDKNRPRRDPMNCPRGCSSRM